MKLPSIKDTVVTAFAVLAIALVGLAVVSFAQKTSRSESVDNDNGHITTPQQTTEGFDPQAVIDYCRKYAKEDHYNEQYPEWPHKDCMNFVSQALHHAGWEFTGQYNDDQQSWYCEDVKTSTGLTTRWSTTWINTDKWHQYALTTGRGVDTKNWNGLRVGDVIQVDQNNDHILDHSMIVTTAANGDYRNVRISDHGRDVFDYPLLEVLEKWPKDGKFACDYALTMTY